MIFLFITLTIHFLIKPHPWLLKTYLEDLYALSRNASKTLGSKAKSSQREEGRNIRATVKVYKTHVLS